MKVIIPVAGKGTRMRPHTHTKIKPFICVAGKPALGYIMDVLKEFDELQRGPSSKVKNPSPISEVIFITKHLKEQVEEFIKKNYDFKMRFVEQRVVDGTAGAINLAKPYVDEPVLIIFADTVFEADLGDINNLKENESGIIWGKEVEDYQHFGVMVTGKDGYMTKMIEKPDKPISKLANIGMYYMKDYKLMFEGIKYVYDNDIKLKGDYYLTDAFAYMIENNAKIICPTVSGWYDTGKPETLLESNRLLLEKGRHKIVKTENSVIIPPVHIADGVKIKDSVIGPYATIGKGSEIENSIIRNSIVGENAKIVDLLLEESLVGDDTEVTDNFKKMNIGDHSVVHFSEKKSEKKKDKKKD